MLVMSIFLSTFALEITVSNNYGIISLVKRPVYGY